MPNSKEQKDLVIIRVFDAPCELVWKAWTEPEYLKSWMGPKGYTIPLSEVDLRVGGKSHICMRSPEGQEIHSIGIYKEIVPLQKIVTTDSFADENGSAVPGTHYGLGADFPLELLVTVTFEEEDGKTKMTLRHSGFPAEMKDMAGAGWNESFDKLEDSLKVKEGR